MLVIELLRFEAGLMETNFGVLSPWVPPHSSWRRYYGKNPECKFCGAEDMQEAMAIIWEDCIGGKVG
jgi:hypothetical protein